MNVIGTPATHRFERHLIGDGVTALCGLLLVVTLRLRWVSQGVGSSLVGSDLADALRRLPDSEYRWATEGAVGLYLVAVIGCVTLATAFVRSSPAIVVRGFVASLPALALGALSLDGVMPLRNWNTGAAVACLASAAATVAAVRSLLIRNEETS